MIAVNLTDVNEFIDFKSIPFTISENASNGTSVGTVVATVLIMDKVF
ncbi:MAG: hypothetical protein R2764_25530 [Bacteroidales bacterium]